MPNAKDFLSILETDYHNFEKYFKSFLNNYTKLTNFLERIFAVLPIELVAVLLLSLIIFYILNSLVKDSSKINFVASLIISTLILYFVMKAGILNKKKFDTSFNRLLISPILILGCIVIYYLVIQGIKSIIARIQKNKIQNLQSLEKSIFNLQITYNQIMSEYYGLSEKNYFTDDLKTKISDLETILTRVKVILEKKDKPKIVKENSVKESKLEESEIVSQ